jgi:predicted nucleic acid-binding protein
MISISTLVKKVNDDDKDFSFTDCVSFVVMWEMGIKEAFAFDEHFNQMGFNRNP